MRLVGRTRDDAAGECFDKIARVLGMPYPGGVEMDRAAQRGSVGAYHFPRVKVEGSPLDFSFSGLKSAAINLLHNLEQRGETVAVDDFAACFSDALVGELIDRLALALDGTGLKKVALAGGVSANTVLRARAGALCRERGCELFLPELSLCGDNAAMIASQGYYEFLAGARAGLDLNAAATKALTWEQSPRAGV